MQKIFALAVASVAGSTALADNFTTIQPTRGSEVSIWEAMANDLGLGPSFDSILEAGLSGQLPIADNLNQIVLGSGEDGIATLTRIQDRADPTDTGAFGIGDNTSIRPGTSVNDFLAGGNVTDQMFQDSDTLGRFALIQSAAGQGLQLNADDGREIELFREAAGSPDNGDFDTSSMTFDFSETGISPFSFSRFTPGNPDNKFRSTIESENQNGLDFWVTFFADLDGDGEVSAGDRFYFFAEDSLANGHPNEPDFNDLGISLTIIPLPHPGVMAAMGLGGLVIVRRRR